MTLFVTDIYIIIFMVGIMLSILSTINRNPYLLGLGTLLTAYPMHILLSL